MKARIEQLEEELEGALQRSHNMNNSLLKSNSKNNKRAISMPSNKRIMS